MGCSGSHGAVTVLENGNLATAAEDDVKSRLSVPETIRRVSDVPPLEGTEPPSEEIIESGSKTRPVTPRVLIPPSTAFDIPLRDEEENDDLGSLVKKHPPKRFQKLEEQQRDSSNSLTLEELREKQEIAELRRKQFLEARAMSAKTKFSMRNGNEDQGCA